MMIRSYSELSKFHSFQERFNYLKLGGVVGRETFGRNRFFNQALYSSERWKETRKKIILRDYGHDLGVDDCNIMGHIVVHHINPITIEDILYSRSCLFDPENLISVSYDTHKAIHYGTDLQYNPYTYIERQPNDTCPWKE